MKKLTLLIAALTFSFHVSAQDPINLFENRNELNIGFFNVFDLNAAHDFGVGYKISGERGALRLATGFNLKSYDRDGEDYQSKEKSFGISPRIGYEFHQNFNRLRLYYGADVVTSFYKVVNEVTYPVIDPYETNIQTIKSNEYGLRPILGLTVFLSKSVSLSTETCLNLLFSKSIHEDDDSNPHTTTTKGLNIGLSPLGIVSINFHF
ncbi:MAG: hypothetical protein P1P86_15900 [Bacteroidales bacterium]|nr:hypothetical protein [Bacteroidales bacterium]